MMLRIIGAVFGVALGLLPNLALAHPVAQGSVSVDVSRNEMRVEFRISNEEVFVAGTFGSVATTGPQPNSPKSLDELWRQHGDYLREHVQAEADGTRVTGELAEVRPPKDATINGFAEYVLRFPFNTAAPRKVRLSENILNEIEFAPGNPWEATFAAKIQQDGRTIDEARLLSNKQPLDIALEWRMSDEFGPTPTLHSGRLAVDFFVHGVQHIAGGWDHALFVAALVLAVGRFWQVIALVTAFTVAHTITLTLAVLRLAHLPRGIVEPMIAVSIVTAAALNFRARKDARLGPRMAVAFGFGLFHGLGFASGLVAAMAGFSSTAVAASVAGFSIGVEVGHQLVVIPLVLGMAALRHWRPVALPYALKMGSGVVALAGAYLLVLSLR